MTPVDRVTVDGLTWWATRILPPLAVWWVVAAIRRKHRRDRAPHDRGGAVKASDTIAPPGITRKHGFKAALAIALRFRGDDRLTLLEEVGLLPYEPAQAPRRISNNLIHDRRPGQ